LSTALKCYADKNKNKNSPSTVAMYQFIRRNAREKIDLLYRCFGLDLGLYPRFQIHLEVKWKEYNK